MPVTQSAAVSQHHFFLQNRPKHLNVPIYHILILAWSALVILYGETGLIHFFPPCGGKGGFGPVASR